MILATIRVGVYSQDAVLFFLTVRGARLSLPTAGVVSAGAFAAGAVPAGAVSAGAFAAGAVSVGALVRWVPGRGGAVEV